MLVDIGGRLVDDPKNVTAAGASGIGTGAVQGLT
jgi:hypothetical protein